MIILMHSENVFRSSEWIDKIECLKGRNQYEIAKIRIERCVINARVDA